MNVDWNRAASGRRIRCRHVSCTCARSPQSSPGRLPAGRSRHSPDHPGGAARSARSWLLAFLRDKVARVLGASAAKVEIDTPLTELGLDSLMAVELRNWIEGELRSRPAHRGADARPPHHAARGPPAGPTHRGREGNASRNARTPAGSGRDRRHPGSGSWTVPWQAPPGRGSPGARMNFRLTRNKRRSCSRRSMSWTIPRSIRYSVRC